MKKIRQVFGAIFLIIITSCNGINDDGAKTNQPTQTDRKSNIIQVRKPNISGLFYSPDSLMWKTVDSIFALMSVEEKAAQLIMPATSEIIGIGLPFTMIKEKFARNKFANLLFLKGRSSEFRRQIFQLDSIKKESGLRSIYACDCEPSLIHRKFLDVDSLQPAYLLKTKEEIENAATQTAALMHKLGMDLNFAPVVDLAQNQTMSNRSFSEDPTVVVSSSVIYVRALQSQNIAATLKHFPGHGLVEGDSHKKSVFIDGELQELENFKQVIEQSQPVAVMVGHISIRNNEAMNTRGLPGSISATVMTSLLKNSLDFKGLVVTDAMGMEAVKKYPDADWRALAAGADLVVMPNDIDKLHDRIMLELNTKGKFHDKVIASVKKIIRYKLCVRQLKALQ